MARYKENAAACELFTDGSLESMLPENSTARIIWAALERLDFSAFDALYENDARGAAAIDPRSLVGVWILALLRGFTSSVRLASVCGRDIEFRWLMGGVAVEKSKLSEFRKLCREPLTDLTTQVLSAMSLSGMLPAQSVAIDGTIVRAAASVSKVGKRERVQKRMDKLRECIAKKYDEEDEDTAEIESLQSEAAKLDAALKWMDKRGLTKNDDKVTLSEPEASVKQLKPGGFAPAHNVQIVSDAVTSAILHAEIVDAKNDAGQLAPQLGKTNAVLEAIGKAPLSEAAADSGYHDTEDLVALESAMTTFVPNKRNENRRPPGVADGYTADCFAYDAPTDTFTCPAGNVLRRRKETGVSVVYNARANDCANCPFKPLCCPDTQGGRNINRAKHAELLQTIAERAASDEGHRAAAKRRTTAEGINARLKELLHWPRCRLFGRHGAEAELRWRQLAYNLMLLTGQWKPLVCKPEITAAAA
jgi:transposase